MSLLQVENLEFGYEDKSILKNISFRLLKGEHAGLVGINGAGKSTLFNILSEKLLPDKGTVYKPSSISVDYLDQHSKLLENYTIRDVLKSAFEHLYKLEKNIISIGDELTDVNNEKYEKLLKKMARLQDMLDASDFYKIDSLIDNAATGLGLSLLGLDTPVNLLSGGQRTKVKLARLLLTKPDILLLDEPTNFLDKEHIEWLSNYLCDYPNSFIVISHDTNFLNKVTNVIFQIEFGRLNRYTGNYNKFLKLKDMEKEKYVQEYRKQQKEIHRMEDFIKKNIASARSSTRAKSRRKQLNKIERLEKPKIVSKPHFSFLFCRHSDKLVFKTNNMSIGYNYALKSNLNLEFTRNKKIALIGCNGIGKSTLLKSILGIIPPLSGSITLGNHLYPAYFEQESTSTSNTPMEELWNEFPSKNRKDLRTILGRCGLTDEHVNKPLYSLSGGEQSKVRLCKLMMKPSNWLILDEPTNHLDVDAKEALKESLIEYEGSILLVCHEKEFYEDWVTDIWNLEEMCTTFSI
ncbi:ABC-F family ATP-binding cassette domain-containing protein (plasmid) [Haloimpatiens sp. FM7330]|uniref:ABC-F family ATP-binding cassette domain-containing protein n=1 Tax=Haloimpatiens sp. FM7330 TaxID=3298610 RepID=UPI00363D02DC